VHGTGQDASDLVLVTSCVLSPAHQCTFNQWTRVCTVRFTLLLTPSSLYCIHDWLFSRLMCPSAARSSRSRFREAIVALGLIVCLKLPRNKLPRKNSGAQFLGFSSSLRTRMHV
jgi:hypothetical protein